MPIVRWSDKYCLGVPEMDDHHNRLMDLLNQLHDAMRAGNGRNALEPMLDALASYGVFHFGAEEAYMRRVGTPGLPEHIKEHEGFVSSIVGFQEQLRSGRIALSIQVMTFLKDWLINHILNVDRAYAATGL